MTARTASPHLYLDTNVLLDAIDNRWPASTDLLSRIAAEGWRCSTSRFTFLEMLDAKQENQFLQNRLDEGMQLSQIVRRLGARRRGKYALRRPGLDAIYDQLYELVEESYRFVDFRQPLEELWDQAEEYCAATNMGATDAIHLATAIGAECDILVSRDSDFLAIAKQYIPVALPEDSVDALRELGFDIE